MAFFLVSSSFPYFWTLHTQFRPIAAWGDVDYLDENESHVGNYSLLIWSSVAFPVDTSFNFAKRNLAQMSIFLCTSITFPPI